MKQITIILALLAICFAFACTKSGNNEKPDIEKLQGSWISDTLHTRHYKGTKLTLETKITSFANTYDRFNFMGNGKLDYRDIDVNGTPYQYLYTYDRAAKRINCTGGNTGPFSFEVLSLDDKHMILRNEEPLLDTPSIINVRIFYCTKRE
ncbi:hypothetical protein [Mucilaginibacter phyllosphaerae]|uniref:Lipocalin-like domain-containing protein n=1 Tax=Mucilaginibacter phyllosphaerae TaxID=1812349 RepID=A0A4Y8ABG4_9SPHI|nr:hypothetical protein [Mucilaginibacter phyllosphaerae]MBB3969310.1 hypothetical protein [Mucilaginibacter phyllosphaerae]TEW65894.1 hypothetical protein E2R65_12230 [Mucilaginibacter phyllosphaerae]GGH07589.1 hypothetical protein GCM10007352_12440 [Mucilaginibacter phyllosphaerae]